MVGDSTASSDAFPTVDAARVEADLETAAAELARIGLAVDTCPLDRSATAAEKFRTCARQKHYDIIVIGGGYVSSR
ncbi:hypothetical protein [Saccharopolyspora pogona]|uniref:hypothetical protein n=1 Tax=Saccharopolyspora pogona TaxID=333966 RepID=UPI001684D8CA|nr:hypothetical protein [Saccharopolyspora pogona]